MVRTVKVPPEYAEVFERAETLVARYFADKREVAEHGRIEIGDERYVLVRARSLSVEFYDFMDSLYGGRSEMAHAVARNLLYHLSHAVGRSDARAFHLQLGLEDPLARLSAGPVHFAHSGWAFVDILPESRPQPSDEFYLAYEHPYSFEAESWRHAGRLAERPVCFMNAGYSSGWCEESFGIPLVATEILCVARGDPCCRFVMGPAARIGELVERHLAAHPSIARRVTVWEVPGEFEQRRLEERLRLSERRYRHLFDASAHAILVVTHGRVDDANRRAVDLFGRTRLELVGEEVAKLATWEGPEGLPATDRLVDAVEGALARGPVELRLRLRRQGAPPLEVDVAASRVGSSSDDVLVVVRDVTEKERVSREVRQLQKMDAVGTLAGGIAHDFNNLLTSAAGNLELLRRGLSAGSEQRERVDDAQRALDQAADVVRRLLTFTRAGPERDVVVPVQSLVGDTVRLLREAIDPRIELVAAHEAPEARVHGDPNGLAQVLINLVLNARDALAERLDRPDDPGAGPDSVGPRITVRTTVERESPTPPPGRLSPSHTGRWVRVTVEDNGVGMDETTAGRCLEPFFTTKPVGEGTGLGLSMAYGIVQRHDGRMDLWSRPGVGTRLSVFLPETSLEPADAERVDRPEEVPRGTERVLLGDDQPSLRKLVSHVLSGLGYRVLTAADGAEVLELLQGHAGEIDVVVLDLMMPRLTGKEVLGRILEGWPELPVILSSGYSTDLHAQDLIRAGARAFLPKPYHIDDLARVVREVLDASEHPPDRRAARARGLSGDDA